ncbi:unnamed protein product [Merluccius merluccius]
MSSYKWAASVINVTLSPDQIPDSAPRGNAAIHRPGSKSTTPPILHRLLLPADTKTRCLVWRSASPYLSTSWEAGRAAVFSNMHCGAGMSGVAVVVVAEQTSHLLSTLNRFHLLASPASTSATSALSRYADGVGAAAGRIADRK